MGSFWRNALFRKFPCQSPFTDRALNPFRRVVPKLTRVHLCPTLHSSSTPIPQSYVKQPPPPYSPRPTSSSNNIDSRYTPPPLCRCRDLLASRVRSCQARAVSGVACAVPSASVRAPLLGGEQGVGRPPPVEQASRLLNSPAVGRDAALRRPPRAVGLSRPSFPSVLLVLSVLCSNPLTPHLLSAICHPELVESRVRRDAARHAPAATESDGG